MAFVIGSYGCGDGDSTGGADATPTPPPDGAPTADAAPVDTSDAAGAPDAAPIPPPAGHLVISEVALAGTAREFIEIYNPTDAAVDLSTYYLADHHDYALLPGAQGAGPIPGLNNNPEPTSQGDFIAKFPDGATIAPGQAVVVAINYAMYNGVFDRPADYGIRDNVPVESAMVDPSNLIFVAIGANVNLSNEGEQVVLFTWDGASDVVQDVDMVHAGGMVAAFNQIRAKTNVAVDGPDDGTEATAYRTDALTIGQMDGSAESGLSHKRVLYEGVYEVQGGTGNGITGDDETTENIGRTWDNAATFSAPTPGAVPASLDIL